LADELEASKDGRLGALPGIGMRLSQFVANHFPLLPKGSAPQPGRPGMDGREREVDV